MTYFSDIPIWILFLWGGFVILLSIYFYRKKGWIKEISEWRRRLLISLRAIGLFLLGLLLIGLLIKGTTSEVKKPLLITVVDNSQSMLNYSDSTTVKNQITNLLKTTNEQFKNNFTVVNLTLDNLIENSDSLLFINKKTDLNSILEQVYDTYYGRNIGALCLISDGNYNQGITPILTAQKFTTVPVFTIGVGDTIQKVDHLVQSVTVNNITFLGSTFPVEVTVKGVKTQGEKFKIRLKQDGKIIQTKTLTHQDKPYSLCKTTFLLDATAIGIHEYTIEIEELENEYNYDNNSKSFYVEVLDDRSKILLVWEALNPDIGAIKTVLSESKNKEVVTASIENLPDKLEDYDLIIWHNPGVAGKNEAFRRLNQTKLPKWYIITSSVKQTTISKLNLKATIRKTNQSETVFPTINQMFNLFQLSKETQGAIQKFPPVKVPYGQISYTNASSILAFQRVGNITKPAPLIYFGTHDDIKFSVFYGTGLWRWKITDYRLNSSHNHINELVQKITEYLIIKENTSRLRVELPTLSTNENDFIIKASFYNKSYEPITEPTLNFKLINEKGEEFNYSFLPLEKSYQLNLGRLPKGHYDWVVSTTYNSTEFSKKGEFAVAKIELEKQDARANHQLLKQMASNNNGKFYKLDNYSDLFKELNERKDITSVAYTTSIYHQLIDYIWLLILIIFVFSLEWFIRKYSGAY